jgi:formate dehydrogenase subunit gamma
MTVTTTPPNRLVRFDTVERAVHWCNATLFFVLLFTGAALYAGPVSTWVGHRTLVKNVHVYAGLALPLPVLIGLAIPAGRQFRRDVSRLNRWTRDDVRWWSPRAHHRAELGKFNPGQKLNAVFVGAAIVVMLMTGAIMRWYEPFSDDWRTGATFVHDWTFIVLCVVIFGHVVVALRDPDSMRSMLRGSVPDEWARRERPRWWAELRAAGASDAIGDVDAGAQERVGEPGPGAREVAVVDGVDRGAADGIRGREL